MANSFTETTNQGWLSRIGDSIKGLLFGIIAIPAAVLLLWWNEGRAVQTADSLKEGAAAVVSVSADKVDPGNDKKLVHLTGEVKAAKEVSDPLFRISVPALRLTRKVEIYQWVETKKTEKREKVGGSEETKTTYTYAKEWESDVVNSTEFKQAADHLNSGALIAENESFNAEGVTMGAFKLPDSLVSQLDNTSQHVVTAADVEKLAADLKVKAKAHNGLLFFGADPAAPEIGDQRVEFEIVKPGTFSVLAAQLGETFEPYQTKAGDPLHFIESGAVSAVTMIKNAESANKIMTWVARFFGFLIMAFGFMALMRPLGVLGSVIPLIGNIIGTGTGLISFVLAGTLSVLVIAVAWVVARPLLGVALVVLAVCGLILMLKMAKAGKAAA